MAQLTARVYELERRAGIEAGAAAVAAPPKAAPPPPPPLQPVMPAQPGQIPPGPGTPVAPPKIAPLPKREPADLEGKIGKVWLNRIGIFAILAGVAYFIKYAFDSGWIGPAGRVTIGLVAGIGVILWSERFRKKNYKAFSYSLKAVGVGTLYLSLWGAFQVYHLVPASVAFVAMIAVTAFTMVMAIVQDGEILAAYALVGGFATPLLVSTGENREIVLFSYIAVLNLGMLAAAAFKPWRRLMWGSLLGTVTLYVGWYSRPGFYTVDERGLTVFFVALFAAIFAAIPLVTPLERSRWHNGHSITLMVLPIVNAALLFLALFAMYENEKATLTWYALALAAYYLGLSSIFGRRTGADGKVVKVVNLIHVAIAVAFITIAIPLKLDAHWITIGWLVESAALLAIAVGTRTDFLRYFAGGTLALGVARLLLVDSSQLQQAFVFNSRFATYLVAIAIMAGIVAAGEKFASEREMPFVKIAGLGLNLLALIALTLEAHDFFSRQMAATYGLRNDSELRSQIDLAWNFSYSAIWLIYGAGMMAFGFWKRDAFVRWQALVLMALTIVKVFAYDSWNLGKVYRILSFIGLGVLLMVVSYIYHRDWLKLSPRSSDEAKRTSA
ncbi:MAG TPA: DUF2339 domain-containing protein [Candidatus Angelobacter sp.]|nr:DUF2339 domain-containing protein [Candidatus Angelobacter sp.]